MFSVEREDAGFTEKYFVDKQQLSTFFAEHQTGRDAQRQRVRLTDQQTVRAHHTAVGSPKYAAPYQNRSRSTWKNSYSEVGAVEIFENSCAIIL